MARVDSRAATAGDEVPVVDLEVTRLSGRVTGVQQQLTTSPLRRRHSVRSEDSTTMTTQVVPDTPQSVQGRNAERTAPQCESVIAGDQDAESPRRTESSVERE